MSNETFQLMREFWGFLRERKLWWISPVIVVLLLIAILVVLSESSVIAPFIYSLY